MQGASLRVSVARAHPLPMLVKVFFRDEIEHHACATLFIATVLPQTYRFHVAFLAESNNGPEAHHLEIVTSLLIYYGAPSEPSGL